MRPAPVGSHAGVPLTSGIRRRRFARTVALFGRFPAEALPRHVRRPAHDAGTVNSVEPVPAGMSDTGSESDELAEIRERKRARLRERIEGDRVDGGAEGSEPAAAADAADSPGFDEPVRVNGEAHLDTLVDDHDLVLVDFQADWCGPCQMLEPIVERIAAGTDAVVASVDVDANGGLARTYGVQGVPTLLLFVDGDPVERLVGMQDEGTLRGLIDEHARG